MKKIFCSSKLKFFCKKRNICNLFSYVALSLKWGQLKDSKQTSHVLYLIKKILTKKQFDFCWITLLTFPLFFWLLPSLSRISQQKNGPYKSKTKHFSAISSKVYIYKKFHQTWSINRHNSLTNTKIAEEVTRSSSNFVLVVFPSNTTRIPNFMEIGQELGIKAIQARRYPKKAEGVDRSAWHFF